MGTSIQQLGSKVPDIIDDIFRRTGDDTYPGGTEMYQASINLTMGLIQRLSVSDGIATASTNSDAAEASALPINEALSSELVSSIQEQLTASVGKLTSFGTDPKARSFYLASNPEDIQLIKGVRLTCKFEGRSEPTELTVIFDDQDTMHCVYLPQADGNVVFSVPNTSVNESGNTVKSEYLKNFAKHIVYEMAQGRYKRIENFFAVSHRAGLNLKNFVDEFADCEFPSIQWGSIILTPISEGKQMVNLSVRFDRQNRQPFERALLLIFNSEDMLEQMNFFDD
ncbi:MAG: hypothetical protein AAF572_15070 [Cyanobacteria bacterium P01_B01_bin.77]